LAGKVPLKKLFCVISPSHAVVFGIFLLHDAMLSLHSNMKLNDIDGYNPRVLTLQNKWRLVWRMSVDRKKVLQDSLDTLQEVQKLQYIF
jgi:hypothetical protein